jgi:hypothetical protein
LHGVEPDQHHAESHTIASHSDTTATGAELEELTDGSETALHSHAGGGASLPVDDTTSLVQDPVTNSKQTRIDTGAVADATVRTIWMPNADVQLADVATNTAHGAASAPHSGHVDKTDFASNHSILRATVANNPITMVVADDTLVGKSTGGSVTGQGPTAIRTILDYGVAKTSTSNPAGTDDGYTAGVSLWANTTAKRVFLYMGGASPSAVWVELTNHYTVPWKIKEPTASDYLKVINTTVPIVVLSIGGSVESATNAAIMIGHLDRYSWTYASATDILSSNLTLTTSGAESSTFDSGGAVAADKQVILSVESLSGSPSGVQGWVEYVEVGSF